MFDIKEIDTKGNRTFIRSQVKEIAKAKKGKVKAFWKYFIKETKGDK